jgi:putative FmdB family regulatory protein
MPLYEYECQACGHRLEAQQKLADAPLTKCPECGKEQLQKLISATSFTLKGGGWYKDLYSSAKPGSESASPDTSSSEKKSAESTTTTEKSSGDSKPSSDSKPAAAPSSTPAKTTTTPKT